MWERYSERLRSAMGVGLDQSKPRGLDVGVLTYAFLAIFVISFSSLTRLLQFSRWTFRLGEAFRFRFGQSVQSLELCRFVIVHCVERVKVLSRNFGCSIAGSSRSFGWSGGGSC